MPKASDTVYSIRECGKEHMQRFNTRSKRSVAITLLNEMGRWPSMM